ncbi:MAG: hypothetical protein IJE68_01835 [Clostridia bacterium]|nr:hypothetical protein [Clostridia bacterium]
MERLKLTPEKMMKIVVWVVLACTYIVPSGLIETKYSIAKILFVIPMICLYLLTLKKVHIKEIVFMIILIGLILVTQNPKYIIFLPIIFLDKIVEYKEYIKKYLKESNILYICLGATLIYSIIFFGTKGRYAFTAIGEINQSGLAIFCLGVMLMVKNKKVGIATLAFGLLTISRSYYLALAVYIISKIKFVKKYFIKDILIKLCNYINLTIISSVALVGLGIFYYYQFQAGNIFWGDEVSNRLYNLLDYSNFYRFFTLVSLVIMFLKYPHLLITGLTDYQYGWVRPRIFWNMGVPWKNIEPHNLFFSHLRMYGLFSIVETIYTHFILEKLINKNNFLLYIAIFLYSIILGAGLYSYWLYLTFFMLVLNEDDNQEDVKMLEERYE